MNDWRKLVERTFQERNENLGRLWLKGKIKGVVGKQLDTEKEKKKIAEKFAFERLNSEQRDLMEKEEKEIEHMHRKEGPKVKALLNKAKSHYGS